MVNVTLKAFTQAAASEQGTRGRRMRCDAYAMRCDAFFKALKLQRLDGLLLLVLLLIIVVVDDVLVQN